MLRTSPEDEIAHTLWTISEMLRRRLPPFMYRSPPNDAGMPMQCSMPANPRRAASNASRGVQHPQVASNLSPSNPNRASPGPSRTIQPRNPASSNRMLVVLPITQTGSESLRDKDMNSSRSLTDVASQKQSANPPMRQNETSASDWSLLASGKRWQSSRTALFIMTAVSDPPGWQRHRGSGGSL